MISFFFQDQPYGGGGDLGGAAGAGLGLGFVLITLALYCLVCGVMWWKVFVKAGKPGWASIVPIYNLVVLCEIAGKPAWWVVLFFIPVVSLVIFIILSIAVAKKFGKETAYGVGLGLLSIIFYPMLGFGSAQYDPNAAT